MPEPVINAIVILVLAAVVALAIRSIWKKDGGCCTGDCSRCGGCHK